MNIYHTTSIESALKILESGQYITHKETAKDNCLNCYPFFENALTCGFYTPNLKEAIIIFKWNGILKKYSSTMGWPVEENILYQESWRYFIPSNTKKNLSFKRIYFKPKMLNLYIISYLKNKHKFFWKYLPKTIQDKMVRKIKYKFILDIRKYLEQNKLKKIYIN